MQPPSARFVSRVFHPNVYSDGTVRLGILEHWSPALSVSNVAATVRTMVDKPDEAMIANPYAWHLYKTNPKRYHEIVQHLARIGINKRASADVQANNDAQKKQRLTEDDFDTQELYVSDQLFWNWE